MVTVKTFDYTGKETGERKFSTHGASVIGEICDETSFNLTFTQQQMHAAKELTVFGPEKKVWAIKIIKGLTNLSLRESKMLYETALLW